RRSRRWRSDDRRRQRAHALRGRREGHASLRRRRRLAASGMSTVAAPRIQSSPGRGAIWMLVPALVLLLVFFALPYLTIITMSLREASTKAVYGDGFTLAHYTGALGDPFIWRIMGRTVAIGAIVTVLSLLLGYPVA